MSIYDLNTETFIDDFMPPDKRVPNLLAHAKAGVSAIQYNVDEFKIYREGIVRPYWDLSATYAIGDYVLYQGQEYQSLQNANTARPPFDTAFWVLTHKYAIGANERVRYSAKKLVFEYALNKYFGGTFRQPPLLSDIYITNSAFFNNSFIIGGIESNSSVVFADKSSGFIINDYLVQLPYSFVINVPTAVYVGNGNSDVPFLNFANTITIAGKTPSITVY